MSDFLTPLDLAKARRALETANAPVFSLGAALRAARERCTNGEFHHSTLMDEATRPRDPKERGLWDRLQSAKCRIIAYDAQPQTPATRPEPSLDAMTDDELKARIAALRRGQQ